MSNFDHFEINVCEDGRHYMKVVLPQQTTRKEAINRCEQLQDALNSRWDASPYTCTLYVHFAHSELVDTAWPSEDDAAEDEEA